LYKQYPSGSMTAEVFATGKKYPDLAAYEYMGSRRTYRAFEGDVREAARAFYALGIRAGDRVMLSMPNVPQGVVLFYALNLVGAVACMTHPLSSAEEMAELIASAQPRLFVTLYQFYDKFRAAIDDSSIEKTVLTGPGDALGAPLRTLLALRDKKPTRSEKVLRYKDFLRNAKAVTTQDYEHTGRADDLAAVLYSGGTTGRTKGILLTNLNFNAQAILTAEAGDCLIPDTKFLAVLPIFHGFGLGVCVHMAMITGVTSLLVPRFTPASYAKLLKKSRPEYIAGVPTLFEALLRLPNADELDMSQMRGVFSGGDSLNAELKTRFDAYLAARGAKVEIREGYGLTECVTACCLTPKKAELQPKNAGSIGLPFRDMEFKIVPTDANSEYGEICISGPTIMRGYDNEAEATAQTLRTHDDGKLWLHTGDLGEIDENGYVYFRGRIKRMLVSSGYNVYPFHVESIMLKHPLVRECCVIGVPDAYRMQRVKAFVVLENGVGATIQDELEQYAKTSLAPYNRPREIEIVEALPKTLVGKVAYAELTAMEQAKAAK